MNVVKISKETIILNSGMNESAFGKTNYSSIINQAGILFDGKEITKWSFSDVKAEPMSDSEDRTVVYCGPNPFKGEKSEESKTLLDFFEEAGHPEATLETKKRMYTAGLAVCSFLTEAATKNLEIPKIGAGGIIVKLNEADEADYKSAQLLFLPQGLFEGSTAGLNKFDYANLQGCWINSTIFDLPSICFERAVIAYKMLTGRFPFPASDLEERNADILDRKFLPLELCVNGIDLDFAGEINRALKLNSNVVNIPGKKQKGKASEDLTPKAEFPMDILASTPEKLSNSSLSILSDEELSQRASAYMKAQASKVNTKRAIRRNTSKILITAIALVIFGILTANYIKTNNSNYTSVGLTSTETIEAFLQGVNDKDPTLLDQLARGKKAKYLIDSVSRIYVISKQRKTYNGDNGFASPENWIVYLKDESFLSRTGLYGVSNAKIDGTLASLQVELHEKKEKIPALTEEKGITLTDGLKSVHNVEYYMIHTEGDSNELEVDYIKETYTLTFKKNRWIITDINTISTENLQLSASYFFTEYFQTLNTNEGDVVRTVETLRVKYPWLPQKTLIEQEIERQKELSENPFMIF